jgi:hypothetical protein
MKTLKYAQPQENVAKVCNISVGYIQGNNIITVQWPCILICRLILSVLPTLLFNRYPASFLGVKCSGHDVDSPPSRAKVRMYS